MRHHRTVATTTARTIRPFHTCAYRGCSKPGTEPVSGTPVLMCMEHTLLDLTVRLRAVVLARLP